MPISQDVEHVLLVGGSTRMPMVRRMLGEVFGQEPDASVAADEAVAHGAALYAEMLLAESRGNPPTVHIKNVNSHSLGVIGIETSTGQKRNVTLIPRNTALPAAHTRPFKTKRDNQRSILVEIVEGENPAPDECTRLGQCTVRDLPPNLPAGSPVNVAFEYQGDGRLKVCVSVPNTKRRDGPAERFSAGKIPAQRGSGQERYAQWPTRSGRAIRGQKVFRKKDFGRPSPQAPLDRLFLWGAHAPKYAGKYGFFGLPAR